MKNKQLEKELISQQNLMPEAKSLLELLRGQNKKKGKKLIVISDYDDVLQPHKPRILYNIEKPNISFAQYFDNF